MEMKYMKEHLDKIVEHKSLLLFAGGAVSAYVAKKIIESDAAKDFCVNTAAEVMKIQDQAEEVFQDVKDGAEDIRYEAQEKNKDEIYNVEVADKDEIKASSENTSKKSSKKSKK